MNAKDFYRAIGQIDDDLILDAAVSKKQKTVLSLRLWIAAAAALICLAAGGVWFFRFRGFIIWNTGIVSTLSKEALPTDCTMRTLAKEELVDYYQLSVLPDTITTQSSKNSRSENDLSDTGSGTVILSCSILNGQIYEDSNHMIISDHALIRYETDDGSSGITLTLSRISSASPSVSGSDNPSRIHGISVILTKDMPASGLPVFSAVWIQNGTDCVLTSEGMTQDDFLSVLNHFLSK